ncbi:MAG: DUF4173 domain-containing protein [Gemmatimonadetes bacterium]|nr:DUF4173 domain-containing protein [Gemmatimonadota bacterium]
MAPTDAFLRPFYFIMQNTLHYPSRTTPLLLAALGVGIAGDLLIPSDLWRAGFALWMAVVAIVAIGLRGRNSSASVAMTAEDGRSYRERTALITGTAVAAAGLAWRDAEMLLPIDLLSTLCMGALVAWHGTGRQLGDLTVVQSLRAAAIGVVTLATGAPSALRDGAEHSEAERAALVRHLRAIMIGIVLGVPPFLLVGGLLGASDQRFADHLSALHRLLTNDGVAHFLTTAFVGWLALGWLRNATRDRVPTVVPEVRSPGLPLLTVSVGLTGLIALLALYLTTQAQALFGGAEHLLATVGLTPAEYARRGFFEMVVASGVVVGTLVVAEWLLHEDPTARRRFAMIGGVLVAEVAALLLSAVARMRLYIGEFGLTEDRVLAVAIMALVAAALAVVVASLPRGQSTRFAPRMLGVTIGWVALLNVVNPEAIVVRTNLARAAEGGTFDVSYHAKLSGDAVAVLVAEAGRLPAPTCAALSTALTAHWSKRLAESSGDWRSESLSSRRARTWHAAGATLPCRVEGALEGTAQ